MNIPIFSQERHNELKPEKRLSWLSSSKTRFFAELNYIPHRGQKLIHRSKKRFIIAICGRRWGKTLCAAREALFTALKPGARVLVTAPYQRLTDRIFFRIWIDALVRLRLPVESKSRSEYFLRFPWDALIEARTAENPDNLVGEGYDLIVFDECAKARADVWEHYLAPSLMDKCGRALFISTPEGFNWLYELYLQVKRDRALRRDWLAFTSPTRVNPHIKRSELLLMRRLLSDFAYAQEVEARFIRPVNLVYPQFSLERHVKPLSYDPRLPLYRALDFGYVNPFVCLTIQIGPNDEVRVLSEIYLRGRTLSELAEIMCESLAPYFAKFCEYWLKGGYQLGVYPPKAGKVHEPPSRWATPLSRLQALPTHPLTGAPRFPQSLSEFNEGILYFCDPAGAGERASLHSLGFITIAKPSPISLGIELIRRALGSSHPAASDEPPTTEQAPRLFIDPSCVNLIREFTSYRYPSLPSFSNSEAAKPATSRHSSAESEASASEPRTSEALSAQIEASELYTSDPRALNTEAPSRSFYPRSSISYSLSPSPSFSESPLKENDHALDALRYFFTNMFS